MRPRFGRNWLARSATPDDWSLSCGASPKPSHWSPSLNSTIGRGSTSEGNASQVEQRAQREPHLVIDLPNLPNRPKLSPPQ
ncbi:hypothetical protein F2Q69_00061674 [Brassica cretica]|uniref:Uncharacterized protein n=1 Tax=Brassica cretica TaxID=69181 RepID=A0A8S9RQ79_BRACR|nr:hypothetical protein F2Q69_00061674 [Brassica cretica]